MWPSLSVYNDKIYLISGEDDSGNYIEDIWEYDPATDSWKTYSSENFIPLKGNHFWTPVLKISYILSVLGLWMEIKM